MAAAQVTAAHRFCPWPWNSHLPWAQPEKYKASKPGKEAEGGREHGALGQAQSQALAPFSRPFGPVVWM